jgi:ribosomal protein S18 acetylase RimI-like enzyme
MFNTAVQLAEAGDEERAIGTIVLAFAADPPARWLYPQAGDFLAHFPHFVRAFAGGAFGHRSAYGVDGFAGAALWLPPGVEPDEQALVGLLERSVAGPQLGQVFELLEQMGRFHPEQAHWYLPMIGVDPARQRQGHGDTLLRETLAHIDAQHHAAYLESTNPANIPLYERHGFVLQATLQVGTAPPMFPMVRAAR